MRKLDLTTQVVADSLKTPRSYVSLILTGKRGISPVMAVKLSIVFNTKAEDWLKLQFDYEINIAKKKRFNLKPLTDKKVQLKRLKI